MVTVVSTNVADMVDGAVGQRTFTASIIELLCTYDRKYSSREYCKESFYIEYMGAQGIIHEATGRESTEVTYTVFDTHHGRTVPEIDLIGCIEVADNAGKVDAIFGVGIETIRDVAGNLVWNSGWHTSDSAEGPADDSTALVGGGIYDGLSPHILIVIIISVCLVVISCIFYLICCMASPDGDRRSPFPWVTKSSTQVFVCKNTSSTFALEVRNIPDSTHAAIGTIEPGERVVVLAEHTEWYKIQMQPKWNDGSVPVVWAMKVVFDEEGRAHELLTRLPDEPAYYPLDLNNVGASDSVVIFPGLGHDHLNTSVLSSNYGNVASPAATNVGLHQRSFVQQTVGSPVATNSSFVLGETGFEELSSFPAWADPATTTIYTPHARHLQTQAAPPMSSTPHTKMTPRPDYSPAPMGMFTGLIQPSTPVPKMNALSPKAKITPSRSLRTGRVFESPTTTMMHGVSQRWSTPVGGTTPFTSSNYAFTDLGDRAAPAHRCPPLELCLEEETVEIASPGIASPPAVMPGMVMSGDDANGNDEYVDIGY